jgi:hypothetical protein
MKSTANNKMSTLNLRLMRQSHWNKLRTFAMLLLFKALFHHIRCKCDGHGYRQSRTHLNLYALFCDNPSIQLKSPYTAPACLSRPSSWLFFACKWLLPPICCWLIKILGTLRWPVISSSASWRAAPSSAIHVSQCINTLLGRHVETHQLGPIPSRNTLRASRPATTWWRDNMGSSSC